MTACPPSNPGRRRAAYTLSRCNSSGFDLELQIADKALQCGAGAASELSACKRGEGSGLSSVAYLVAFRLSLSPSNEPFGPLFRSKPRRKLTTELSDLNSVANLRGEMRYVRESS